MITVDIAFFPLSIDDFKAALQKGRVIGAPSSQFSAGASKRIRAETASCLNGIL